MSDSHSKTRLARGALLVLTDTEAEPRSIAFQYNPSSVCRSLTPKLVHQEMSAGKGEDHYLVKGPPMEMISFTLEFDASGGNEMLSKNTAASTHGIYPQLAALELIMYPSRVSATADRGSQAKKRASARAYNSDAPFTVLVLGPDRTIPVVLTSCFVNEEAFDSDLNPVRASVNLTMRVLSTDDFKAAHPGYKMFADHWEKLESLAKLAYASHSVSSPDSKERETTPADGNVGAGKAISGSQAANSSLDRRSYR